MSWLFSQALVEEYLADICLDGEPSAPLSGNNTQQAYCAPDKMTKFSRLSRFGMTFKPLTDARGKELLTLYLADFHAKTSAQPEKAQELKETNPQCGNTWQGSLARLDLNTSLWKTAQSSLLEDLELSLQTFPKWGLMQNGALYQLPTLVQTISERGFGLGPKNKTFPTPKAQDSRHALYRHNNSKDNYWKSNLGEVISAQVNGGYLNPNWVEWLMNWPITWSSLNAIDPKEYQRWKETSTKTLQKSEQLREMWWDNDPSQASFGQQPNKQSKQQHCNAVPQMPRNTTRQREMEGSHKGSDLPLLCNDIYLCKSQTENVQSEMRKQIGMDETKIVPRTDKNIMARVDRLKAIGNGQVPLCAATAWELLK